MASLTSPFLRMLPFCGLFCILALHGGGAAAAPLLHCRLQQGDTIADTKVAPTIAPYGVTALQVNRFRFKAVVVGAAGRVDYVKLYTYYETGSRVAAGAAPQLRLLHEAKYLAPRAQGDTGPSSLTGTVYLYEPHLGREFSYDCALRQEAA
jgi:hypothetical protein